jgi:subtilase family serine protease
VYHNDAGTFTDIQAGLPGVHYSSVAWGDYDNDGDLDLLLAGSGAPRVYRNDAGVFHIDEAVVLPRFDYCSVAWADYDNDGDIDLLLAGYGISRVYRNDAGTFTDIQADLPGLYTGSVAWGDYDNDGDLDLFWTGYTAGSGLISSLYRNDAGVFHIDEAVVLPGVNYCSVAWGDYDNDGDLDLVLTGQAGSGLISRVYRNDAGTFTDIQAGLPGAGMSSAAWGDYDNDGDLDLFLTGSTAGSGIISRVYRSDGAPANAPSTAPVCSPAAVIGSRVQLKWSESTDAQTPAAGLTYNLRVGTTPGGEEVLASMADAASGFRRVAQMGNVQHRRWWTLQLPPGQYTWSVQAVDGAFIGSPFSASGAFTVTGAMPDLSISAAGLHAAREGDEGLVLSTVVRNVGLALAPGSVVRFFDAREDTALGADIMIPALAPGASDTCSIPWTARCGHDRFRAHVDPDGTLSEIYDRNNSAELSYGDSLAIPTCSPEISITAKYGTLKTANHFGKYLRGIAGSQEEFKATFVDLDAVVDRLSFVIGSRAPVWVTAADQWTYRGFDPGSLTANDTLRVRAFAGQRPVSEEYIGILETRALPTWLSKWFDLGVGPVAMETRDGLPYLTFKLAMAREAKEPPDPEEDEPDTLAAADSSFIEFGDLIDPTIPIVGGKSSKFKLDVTLKVWAPLLEGKSWLAEGHLKKEAEVFGQDNTEEVGVKIWLSESGVDSLLLDPPYKNTLHLWKSPEIESPPFNVAGLQIVFGVAMDLFLHAQVEAWAQDNFDSLLVVFTPSLEADINVVGTVSLAALKFAKVEVIANPNVELGPVFTYARGPDIGNDFDLGGFFQFTLNGRVVASITYKVWKYKKTSSWTVVTFPTYIWRKDFHLAGKPGSGLLALAGEADTSYVDTTEVYVPDVFPYPNAASDTSGTVGFVWIQDVDPDPDIAEPQVYYAEKASEEADWSLEPVTTDDLFKSYATFTYLPTVDPIAVWVQASNTEGETDTTWTLSDILDRQDLWYAARDSGGVWTPAPVFTEVGGVHRADGVPAMTPTASGATLAWVRRAASADSALAPGSGEIYASSYASGSWSAPYALTADNIDDTSPAIRSAGADTAVVVWVREDALAHQPNELVWSKGMNSTWQSPQVLSGGLSNWTKQPPSVTKAEDGRLLATWVETEQITVPVDSVNTQNKVVYHLRASTLAAGETAWSPIEEVFVDSSFVECPVALIDRRNIGAITWRGYNGMDGDLWISLRDLDKTGSTWTLPRCIAPDNLTDWMATATLDANNNLYVIDQQSDLSEPPEPPSGKALFPGGLRLRTKGISNALDLTDLPNRGFRPLTGDLTLGVDSVWVQGATPTVGETDTLAAYVKNIGDFEIDAGGLVRFYQGHPDSAGSIALVPDAVLPAMAPDDSVQVKAPWPVAAGTHRLYAVVDPGETIDEQDDNNNLAYLKVSIVPDLAVDSVRVSDPNPEPGDEVTLRAYVRNVGASPAQDYSVRFSARSGTLDTLTGLTLAPGASAALDVPFIAAQGVDTLYAVIDDPDSLLADPDSTNNRAWEPLRVLPDLAVWIKLRDDVPDSIRFSEGFEESLSVTIANVGGVALDPEDAVKVRILSGNPRAGGVPLLADIAWPIAFPPGFPVGTQDSMLVAWSDIDPMLDSLGVPLDVDGVPIEPIAIFAVVDPDETIEERSTLNNEGFLSIGDGLPQLTMLDGSIAIRPVDGAVDTVSAFVQNLGTTGCQAVLVEFFAGDPDTGGYLIDDRLIPRLVPGETARAWVTWDTPQENITVFAIVDRPQLIAEYNEADNRISQEFSLVVDVPTTPTVPVTLALHPAFPNPFSGSTTISFDLPKQGRVEVAVFDVTGRLVRTLLDQDLPPGRQTLEWDGRSNTQRATATGIYFVRLRVNDELLTRKIVRLK